MTSCGRRRPGATRRGCSRARARCRRARPRRRSRGAAGGATTRSRRSSRRSGRGTARRSRPPVRFALPELAHRLQQPVARGARGLVGDDERLVDQREDPVEHFPLVDTVAGDHRFRGLDRERTREHREPVEHAPLRLVEQLVRPADRGVEGAVPARRELIARRQEPQPLIEAPGDVGGRHPAHARGRELDRERYVIEPLADLDDRGFVLVGEREVGAGHPRPVDEQLDAVARRAARSPTTGPRPTRARRARRAAPDSSPASRPWSTTPTRGRRPRRPRSSRCSQLSITTNASRVLAHAHNVSTAGSPWRSGTPNASRIVAATSAPSSSAASDANHTPSLELGRDLGRDLQRQARLADPARPGQRHQPLVRDERGELLHLVGPADEARALHRQVARQLVERAQRRELLGAELPDEHRAARGRAGDARRDCAASGPARDPR